MQLINFLKDRILSLVREEEAQDGIEYLLVIGGVSVAIIIAVAAAPGFVSSIVSGTCDAIATIPQFSTVTC